MTKIDIVSGFLGAGKTTLINKLIHEAYAGEKLVLIENEFGDIGIDGDFLQEAGVQITEMNSGCICCSLVGDFSRALEQVVRDFTPDRVLIEPSGVGKLSDVIRAVRDAHVKDVVLNSFTVVVDVNKCKMYMKNFGEFFNDQIEHAGCILFSHTDVTTEKKLSEAMALVREYNPKAQLITTPAAKLTGKDLLTAMENRTSLADELAELAAEEACPVCGHHHHHDHDHDHEHCHHDHDHDHEHCHHDHDHEHCHHDHDHDHEHCHHDHDHDHGHHHHHADDVFVSFGRETVRKYTAQELESMLCALADEEIYGVVLRAKGIVEATDGTWLYFDYVPGEPNVRTGSSAVIGKLCVIGADLHEDAVAALFGLA